MKKFTFCLIALFAVLSSFTASAVTCTFVVDNANAVKCTMGSEEAKILTPGENVITANGMFVQILLEAISPYTMTSVTNKSGNALNCNGPSGSFYATQEGEVYTITTANLDTERDATCTIIVDDPSLVAASLSGTSAVVDLVEGSNTVKFISDKEGSTTPNQL